MGTRKLSYAHTFRSAQIWRTNRERARAHRKEQTKAEGELWSALRGGKLGNFRFRRQHPIDRYIVDFCCPAAHLVVEVDGEIHAAQVEADQLRTMFLEERGFTVLRFSNDAVLNDLDTVLRQIKHLLAAAPQ